MPAERFQGLTRMMWIQNFNLDLNDQNETSNQKIPYQNFFAYFFNDLFIH